ncbi:MAG: hypothetical protein HN509_17615 [Halobacteriovoraceae bacterium]|jgi:hypothetical protein|nr:hypothetical protein [Halobacteriovoraceae bacterium]MBT5094574.1 hypothetical protein [Halobacteriovoraceae bacterium]
MKKLLFILSWGFSSSLLAAPLVHTIVQDSLIERGTITFNVTKVGQKNILSIKSKAKTTSWLLGTKKGETKIELPSHYLSEEGYRKLEQDGHYKDHYVSLKFSGRKDFGPYYDCYKVSMRINKKPGWNMRFTYCPEIPALGWGEATLFVPKIPFYGAHTFKSYWNRIDPSYIKLIAN